jgi:ECF sigma factor
MVSSPPLKSTQIQAWIDRVSAGDEAASHELIRCSCDQVAHLIKKMIGCQERRTLASLPEELGARAIFRLYRTLVPVNSRSSREFLRQASIQIRRELIDLGLSFLGNDGTDAQSQGTHSRHLTRSGDSLAEQLRRHLDRTRFSAWIEFHRRIDLLVEEDRETLGLIWYHGLTHSETADLLGVSRRIMIQRWQAARLSLFDSVGGRLPVSN